MSEYVSEVATAFEGRVVACGGGGKGGPLNLFKLIIPKINTGIATWYLLRRHCPPPPPPPRIWARLRPWNVTNMQWLGGNLGQMLSRRKVEGWMMPRI